MDKFAPHFSREFKANVTKSVAHRAPDAKLSQDSNLFPPPDSWGSICCYF